jgi:diacylglycerol kinase family enzyme
MTVDEAATINDGTLHLYSLEVRRWWQVIPLLPALRRGTLRDATRARTLSGPEFEVRPLHHQRHVNTDGEITGKTPAHFRVVPRAIEVFVPDTPGADVTR